MRSGVAGSFLLHAAALAFAWTATDPSPAPVGPPGVALRFAVEPRTGPAALPPPPPLPREAQPPQGEPPRAETPPVAEEFVVPETPAALPVPRAENARLARPLSRPARRPVPEPAPPAGPPGEPAASGAAHIVPPRLARGARATVDYPEAARRRGLEGRVVVRARLDANGAVREATVLESSGHRMLDEAALASVRRWRFEPATRDGIPVAHRLVIPVRFALE